MPSVPDLVGYTQLGNIVGPPTFALVTVNAEPDRFIRLCQTHQGSAPRHRYVDRERSGMLAPRPDDEFYYQTVSPAIKPEGDTMRLLDVLAGDGGVRDIFTDEAAAVSYRAN